jgi:hypothetical protein
MKSGCHAETGALCIDCFCRCIISSSAYACSGHLVSKIMQKTSSANWMTTAIDFDVDDGVVTVRSLCCTYAFLQSLQHSILYQWSPLVGTQKLFAFTYRTYAFDRFQTKPTP